MMTWQRFERNVRWNLQFPPFILVECVFVFSALINAVTRQPVVAGVWTLVAIGFMILLGFVGGSDDDPVPSPRTPPNGYTAWGSTVHRFDTHWQLDPDFPHRTTVLDRPTHLALAAPAEQRHCDCGGQAGPAFDGERDDVQIERKLAPDAASAHVADEIGRASCRERVSSPV